MTWLPLAISLGRAGASLALVGNRHAARLRGALAGKNKSDVIDAAMLSRAGEFFSLAPMRFPESAELALRVKRTPLVTPPFLACILRKRIECAEGSNAAMVTMRHLCT